MGTVDKTLVTCGETYLSAVAHMKKGDMLSAGSVPTWLSRHREFELVLESAHTWLLLIVLWPAIERSVDGVTSRLLILGW